MSQHEGEKAEDRRNRGRKGGRRESRRDANEPFSDQRPLQRVQLGRDFDGRFTAGYLFLGYSDGGRGSGRAVSEREGKG